MQIKYRNKKLEKACTDAFVAQKAYGELMAEKIQMRIDQITAADTVESLVRAGIGRCHPLSGNRANQYAMDLVHPYRLVFEIKRCTVQVASIEEIINYH